MLAIRDTHNFEKPRYVKDKVKRGGCVKRGSGDLSYNYNPNTGKDRHRLQRQKERSAKAQKCAKPRKMKGIHKKCRR